MAQPKPIAMRSLEMTDVARSLQAVLCAVDYGILLTDLDHVALACNGRFGELFGVDPEDVVHDDVEGVRAMVRSRIVHYAEWAANLQKVYEDPQYEQADELELRNPAMTLRRYSGPVRDERGAVIGRLWTFLDVTSAVRKRLMQDALREATLFFDPDPERVCQFVADTVGGFYKSVTVVSILKDDFMRFHTVGGPPSPARGMPGNRLEESFCQFCLQTLEPLIIQDARLDDKTSRLLPVRAGFTRYAGVPIYDPLGDPIGTFCFLDNRSDEILDADDVSFLSLASMKIGGELERQRQIDLLRSDLDQTTEELRHAQAKLIQSEKLAVTGTLAASIAHDIRNILSSLSIQVDMEADEPEKALSYVKDSLSRFDILAHRLLSYARPKGFALEHVDLNQVVERVGALLEPHFLVSRVALNIHPSDPPAYILGDEGRLEHLIVNLAVNALQALDPGGKLDIAVDAGKDWVNLGVADDGPGIPPEARNRLFEPFSSTRADGFGLGLYSCMQIAREHDGLLECETNPREGTRFHVRFRRAY
ncbi:MAG TPA: ATP-binding protein [Fimbriimonadaceae bacterium]|nr:ATP-binding protein [Fimbriimonadaceae bacterium]